MNRTKTLLLAGVATLGLLASAHADQPRPPGRLHVLLISVDGMHEVDLRLWVQNHPTGALASLTQRGVTYSKAYTTAPSDSFPGMIAQVTGGTPKSTGVYYDDSYERTFFAPGSNCAGTPGAETAFAENIDKSLANVTAGGTLGQPLSQIDPALLPQHFVNGVCKVVYPHEFIRVNTLFEVLKQHGLHTAWSDKHPAYEILSGPSGQGIEDLYTPEINSQAPMLPAGNDYTKGFAATRAYDTLKVTAVLNQIDGLDSTGAVHTNDTPSIFGMNFQSVSVGQKLLTSAAASEAALRGGYLDAQATPGNALTQQLQFVDDSIGKMVNELKMRDLYDSTVIIISAKHGQSPIDPAALKKLPDAYATVLANFDYDFNIADDASLIWLKPSGRTPAIYQQALAALQANATALGIDRIISRERLAELYRDPFTDSRTPDFYVLPVHGVVYTGSKTKIAEHGGASDDDRHVGLLVSAPGLPARTVTQPVMTTQIAPTIVGAFHINPLELQAVREERTPVLPGLRGGDDEDDRGSDGRQGEQ